MAATSQGAGERLTQTHGSRWCLTSLLGDTLTACVRYCLSISLISKNSLLKSGAVPR